MVPIDAPYDVVVTTNSGYPLDQNLYQSIKGVSSARNIVRRDGSIIIATACEEGIPEYGEYYNLLKKGGSPQGILDMISTPGFQCQDQWQVQIQALLQLHADVYVYSDGLTDAQIEAALLTPCSDIPALVERLRAKYGPDARICVMPDGPQTIGYLKE
jgi:nickel-dependent lactate racemase